MVTLRLFAALAGFGAAIGLWRVFRDTPFDQRKYSMGSATAAVLGALTGARAGYVLAHPQYFSLHPEEVINFWLGGFNAFGAFTGALVFTLLAVAILRIRALPTLDRVSQLLLPMGTLIWLGLWYEGIAYGKALPTGGLFALPTPDETGALTGRFPLQFIAAISLLTLLFLIESRSSNSRPGFRFALLSLGFFTHTLVFSLFRHDQIFQMQGIRSDAFLSLAFAAIFAILVLGLLLTPRKSDKMNSEA